MISIKGYRIDIPFLQFLHVPRETTHDRTGIRSRTRNVVLHDGHFERTASLPHNHGSFSFIR